MVLRRDSFSDRVCDDLSEVLLQYLSLEDKLKLECVSKQFQRTIFQRHYVFDERFLYFSGFSSHPSLDRKRRFEKFSSILKKCPNIRIIDLYDKQLFESNLQIISNNLSHSPEIHLHFNALSDDISNELFTTFVEKFGSKLKCFKIYSETNWKRLISLPNISELEFSNYWIPPNSQTITQLNFDKLNKCQITFTNENIDSIDVLFDKFKSVRHLDVDIWGLNRSNAQLVVNQLSKLNKLIDLRYRIRYSAELLKQITLNCSQLKRIYLTPFVKLGDHINQLLSPFIALKQLKRLYLIFNWSGDPFNPNNNTFSLKSFGKLSNITHLELFTYSSKFKTDETFIEDIETVFPNLQFLIIIGFRFKASFNKLKQRLIGLITRMERLQKIHLNQKYRKRQKEENKEIIIKSTPKWKTIESE